MIDEPIVEGICNGYPVPIPITVAVTALRRQLAEIAGAETEADLYGSDRSTPPCPDCPGGPQWGHHWDCPSLP